MFAKWNSSRSNEEGSYHGSVINDTGRETKKKTMEWTSEALRAAPEVNSEIKPITK